MKKHCERCGKIVDTKIVTKRESYEVLGETVDYLIEPPGRKPGDNVLNLMFEVYGKMNEDEAHRIENDFSDEELDVLGRIYEKIKNASCKRY